MSADSGLHRLAEVVDAAGQEDVGTLCVLVGVGTVDNLEHLEETLCAAGLHEVPLSLLVVVDLAGVDDLHAVEIHLTVGTEVQGDGASLALVVEGDDLCIHILIVLARQRADLLAVFCDDNVTGIAVAAEGERYDGLRTYEQVDLVLSVALEGPAVLCVVPVETACGIEGLVVLSVESLVGEVEGVLLIGAGRLDLRSHGIERDVFGDDSLSGVLRLAVGIDAIPAAHLLAFGSRSVVVVKVELADHLVLLTSELAEHRLLVGVDVGQIEVGLLYEGQQILDRGFAQGHWDMCINDSPRITTRKI